LLAELLIVSIRCSTGPIIDLLDETHFTDEQMFSAASFSGLFQFHSSLTPPPQISHVMHDFDATASASWGNDGNPK